MVILQLFLIQLFLCFLKYHEERNNDITVLSADMKDPTNYGRIVRDENANVVAIVEEKDAVKSKS